MRRLWILTLFEGQMPAAGACADMMQQGIIEEGKKAMP